MTETAIKVLLRSQTSSMSDAEFGYYARRCIQDVARPFNQLIAEVLTLNPRRRVVVSNGNTIESMPCFMEECSEPIRQQIQSIMQERDKAVQAYIQLLKDERPGFFIT